MASINKTPIEQRDNNNLEEPLTDQDCDVPHGKKDIVLKFSGAKPYVDTTRPKDNDSNYMVTETTSNKAPLWFDDVSPTSSNNILSEDENEPLHAKKPENLFMTIINTVNYIYGLMYWL